MKSFFVIGVVGATMGSVTLLCGCGKRDTSSDVIRHEVSTSARDVMHQMAEAEEKGDWNSVLSRCTGRGRGYIIGMVMTPLLWDAYAQPGGHAEAGKESRDLIEKYGLRNWKRFEGATVDVFYEGLAGHLGSEADEFVSEALVLMDSSFTEMLLKDGSFLPDHEGETLLEVDDKIFRFRSADGKWLFDGEIEPSK
jgi:hypothetical protein